MPNFDNKDKRSLVTAVIEAWPYTISEIENAVYSASNVAEQVLIVAPEGLCPYEPKDLADLPADVLRVPFWGNFATMRNEVLTRISTPWAFLLFGNESFVTEDRTRLLEALDPDNPEVFRVVVATGLRGQILAEPVRLVPRDPNIRFTGRIWPQLQGSLMEYGYAVRPIDAHVFRLEDRASTFLATQRLRRALEEAAQVEARHWPHHLRLAHLYWALGRHQDMRGHLHRVPPHLPPVVRRMGSGLEMMARLDEVHYQGAREAALRVLEDHPNWADAQVIRGRAAMGLGHYDEALQAFLAAQACDEPLVTYLDPGYASYQARLHYGQALFMAGDKRRALASLMALIQEVPGYRPAWQQVLASLRGVPPEEIFGTMATVVAPSKIRHFFGLLAQPTADESPMKQWLFAHQFN